MCGKNFCSWGSVDVSGCVKKLLASSVIIISAGFFILSGTVLADGFELEGKVGLPHAGRVKQKVQVESFDVVTAPMRSGSANTGSVSSAPGRWNPRDTYQYVEMRPLAFLQDEDDSRHCLMEDASRGRFRFKDLAPGSYKLTFAIPDLGFMEMNVKVSADVADSDGKVKLEFEFDPQGTVIEPVERKGVADKAVKAFEKGSSEFGKGKLKNALKEFEKAVEEDEGYAEAWEYMGMIQHTEEKLDDAEISFRKSLEIDPNSFRSLADLGTILLVKGDAAGARELYEKALLIRPDEPQPRAQLGMALFQLQELSLALDQLVKARTIDPAHFSQPQLLAAEIYRLWGEYDNMKAELESFLENYPDDPKADAVKQALAGM